MMADFVFVCAKTNMPQDNDYFVMDATKSVELSHPSKVTKFPVSKGNDLTTHVQNENIPITVSGQVTNHPVGSFGEVERENLGYTPGSTTSFQNRNVIGHNVNRVQKAIDILTRLRESQTTFELITQYKSYSPCVLLDFSYKLDKQHFHAINIDLKVEQIRTADTDTVTLYTTSKQADAQGKNQNGNTSTQEPGESEWSEVAKWFDATFVQTGEFATGMGDDEGGNNG